MSGRMRGAQALLFGTSFVALAVGNGSAAFAQSTQTLDPITVLATKTEEKAIESLAGVSTCARSSWRSFRPRGRPN